MWPEKGKVGESDQNTDNTVTVTLSTVG